MKKKKQNRSKQKSFISCIHWQALGDWNVYNIILYMKYALENVWNDINEVWLYEVHKW